MIDRRHFLSNAGTTALASMLPLGAVEAATKGHAAAHAASPASLAAERVLTGVSEELLAEYPDDATFLGLDTGPHAALHGRLPDRSLLGNARRAAGCAARLKRLQAIDTHGLSPLETINIETAIYAHELADEAYRRFHYGDNVVLHVWQAESNSPYAVSQGAGHFATIPDFLDSSHKVETKADADAYLARLEGFAKLMDQEIEVQKHDMAMGVFAPDFALGKTVTQMENLRKPAADKSPLTAARAATCDTLATFDVECDCRLVAALTMSAGPMSHPTRHPVIAYVLATPLTTMQRSASAGTSVGIEANCAEP